MADRTKKLFGFGFGILIGGIAFGICASVVISIPMKASVRHPIEHEPEKIEAVSQIKHVGSQNKAQLSELLKVDSPFSRKQYLSTLVGDLNKDGLIDLIQDSLKMSTSLRLESIQETLFAALAKVDGETALEQVWTFPNLRSQSLVRVVFSEWSKSNFEIALRKATLLNGQLKRLAIEIVFETRNDLSESVRLIEARQYGLESILEVVISKENARDLLHEPVQALEQVLTDSVENVVQHEVLIDIINAWIELDGVDALLPLVQTLKTHDLAYTDFHRRLVVEATKHDPQKAWEYVLNVPSETQEFLQPGILEAWTKRNAREALVAVSQISDPVKQRNLQNRVLFFWPSSNPMEALENLESVPQESRRVFIATAIRKLTRLQQQDAATMYLQQLDSQGEDTRQAKQFLVSTWARKNASDALDWVLENSSETEGLRHKLLKEVLPHVALVDLPRALDVALAARSDESIRLTDRLDYTVIKSLVSNGHFEEIKSILKEQSDITGLRTFIMVAKHLIDFNRIDEAIEIAHELPESKWTEYFRSISFQWITLDSKHLIENLKRVPGTSSKEAIAQQVLRQRDRAYFSDDEIEYVKSFLDAAD